MKVTRLFTGPDQQSYFEDIELQLNDSEFGKLTAPVDTKHISFGEVDEPHEITWHNAPCSQYVIILKGSVEMETGDGTKRVFKEGDVILAEDTTGQGHITRGASDGVRRYLVVPVK